MSEHTAKAFDADLNELGSKLKAMAHIAEKQIAGAFEALANGDAALAKQVIPADAQIDALQREIEERAVTLIARRQPVAVDLREIVGTLRIANDLERVGDLAGSVAKRVILSVGESHSNNGVTLQLKHMEQLVLSQLSRVVDSYERRDAGAALDVWQKDVEVDGVYNSLFRELLTYMMEDARNITFCTHLLFCAKNFERMGDHATNIAETVYYMVNGTAMPGERPKC